MTVQHPAPWAAQLTALAAARSVFQRAHLASPSCPTCGGRGWHCQRVEYPMAGVEASACKCTMEAL